MNITEFTLLDVFCISSCIFPHNPLGLKNWPVLDSVTCSRWTWKRMTEWMKHWTILPYFPFALLLVCWPKGLKMNWLIRGLRENMKNFQETSLLLTYILCHAPTSIILWSASVNIRFTTVRNTIYCPYIIVFVLILALYVIN